MDKKAARIRRAKRARFKIKELSTPRLSVHRTSKHIYGQLIMPDGKVMASASTLGQELRDKLNYGGNIEAAVVVGKAMAEAVIKSGITKVAFDRSGFKYHGRVKAFADAAREQGLEF